MKTQGYYSSSSIMSSSSKSPNQNLRNDIISPITSPNESILMRYLRSGLPSNLDNSSSPKQNRSIRSSSGSCRTPLSAVENLEDDVIVMDGILVDSTNSAARFRNSPVNSDSTSSNSAFNRERAHGQEEIRQILLSQYYDKELFQNRISDQYYSPVSSMMYSSGSSKFAYETMRTTPSAAKEAANLNFKKALSTQLTDASTFSITDPYYSPLSSSQSSSGSSRFSSMTQATPPSAKEAGNLKFNKALPVPFKDTSTVSRHLTNPDWSPLDDGITVQLQFSRNGTPSRKAVDENIHSVLYGPTTQKKRLPVFIEIFPE